MRAVIDFLKVWLKYLYKAIFKNNTGICNCYNTVTIQLGKRLPCEIFINYGIHLLFWFDDLWP